MSPRCSICLHEDRGEIDAAYTTLSNRRIAARWKLAETSVRRHREHVMRRINAIAVAQGRTLASSLDRLHGTLGEAEAIARKEQNAETLVKVVQAGAKLAEVEFGTKAKVEQTTRQAPSSAADERAELARLKADIEERERELGKDGIQ